MKIKKYKKDEVFIPDQEKLINTIVPDRRISRILALKALYQYEFLPENIDQIGSFKWIDKDYSDFIISYAKKIFFGVIRNQEKIDKLISRFSRKKTVDQIDLIDRIILRLSIYQIQEETEVKPKIIIDEAIEISKSYSTQNSFKFINGLLDSFRKDFETRNNEQQKIKENTNPDNPDNKESDFTGGMI